MVCAACGFHVDPKLGLFQVFSDVMVMLDGFGPLVLGGKKLVGAAVAATSLSSPASCDG